MKTRHLILLLAVAMLVMFLNFMFRNDLIVTSTLPQVLVSEESTPVEAEPVEGAYTNESGRIRMRVPVARTAVMRSGQMPAELTNKTNSAKN